MAKCFVIQPFDEGDYDRRYKEVLVPAIKAAGLEPYRVDQDPSVTGIMESIEEGIEESSVCLADISINPDYSSRKHKMSKRARHVESDQRVTGYPQKTAETRPG